MKRLMSVVAFTGLLLDGAFAQSTVPSIPATLTVKNVKLAGKLKPKPLGTYIATPNRGAVMLVDIVNMSEQAGLLLKTSSGPTNPHSSAKTTSTNFPSKGKVGIGIAGGTRNILRVVGGRLVISGTDFENALEVELDPLCGEAVESVSLLSVGDNKYGFVAKNARIGAATSFYVGFTATDDPKESWFIYRVEGMIDNFTTCPGGCKSSYIRYGQTKNAITFNTNVEDADGRDLGTLITAIPLAKLVAGDPLIDSYTMQLNEDTYFAKNVAGSIRVNIGASFNEGAMPDTMEIMPEAVIGAPSFINLWNVDTSDMINGLTKVTGQQFTVDTIPETVDVEQGEGDGYPRIISAGAGIFAPASVVGTTTGASFAVALPYGKNTNLNGVRIFQIAVDAGGVANACSESNLIANDRSSLYKPSVQLSNEGKVTLAVVLSNPRKQSIAHHLSFGFALLSLSSSRNTPIYLLKPGSVPIAYGSPTAQLSAFNASAITSDGSTLYDTEVAEPVSADLLYDDGVTTAYFYRKEPL